VADDPGNERDFLWQRLDAQDRAALTVPFAPYTDGLRARFPIIVQAWKPRPGTAHAAGRRAGRARVR